MKRWATTVLAVLCGGAITYGCGSSGTGNGGGDAGGGNDATSDVNAADSSSSSSGGGDSGGDTGGGSCPTPVTLPSNYMPPAYAHARQQVGACAPSDITAYDAACINTTTASGANCSAFDSAHATCAGCLQSKLTDSSWGPVVTSDGVENINIAGCIELTDPSATSCEASEEALIQCEHAACDSPCPVTDQASFAKWQSCTTAADKGECKTYLAAVACIGTLDAGASSICNPQAFEAFFLAVAPLFCGGGDAGTGMDGGGDATGD